MHLSFCMANKPPSVSCALYMSNTQSINNIHSFFSNHSYYFSDKGRSGWFDDSDYICDNITSDNIAKSKVKML